MENTVNFIEAYYVNNIEGAFKKEDNGSCLALEYEVNGLSVRYIVTKMELDLLLRKVDTTMLKENKNEFGEWSHSGSPMHLEISDKWYVDTATGKSYNKQEAYELVDDLEKPIPDTDPVEYYQKSQLKEGFVNEVDYMIQANSELFTNLETQVKMKVLSIYGVA